MSCFPVPAPMTYVLSHSVMSDSAAPWIRLLCPWGFSRHEYWSRLPCPPPGLPCSKLTIKLSQCPLYGAGFSLECFWILFCQSYQWVSYPTVNSFVDYLELPASFFGLKMPSQFCGHFLFYPCPPTESQKPPLSSVPHNCPLFPELYISFSLRVTSEHFPTSSEF